MTKADSNTFLPPDMIEESRVSYRDLMKIRVHEILVVASLYDAFKLEEDGNLTELIFAEYKDMNFVNAPHVNRVSTASQALKQIGKKQFDLIITMSRISDMDPFEFSRQVKETHPDLPVILLAASIKETNHFVELEKLNPNTMDKIFFWSGNTAVLPAIIKYSEDKRNAERDIIRGFVRAIIIVEDSPQFYSAFLPMLYKEITEHSLKMMKREYDDDLKLLRVRSRPRVLLASSYEEGLEYFEKYQQSILAVISDIIFPKDGKMNERAGLEFLSEIQKRERSVPLVLQSNNAEMEKQARKMNVRFFNKESDSLLMDLRNFVVKHCGFSDFRMNSPNNKDDILISDLRSMEKALEIATTESIEYHAKRNHFSNWLSTRGYLRIAAQLKAIRDISNMDVIRAQMIDLIRKERRKKNKDASVDLYNPETYDAHTRIVRIGTGSLGGKARGIVFTSRYLKRFSWQFDTSKININVPRTAVVATDIYDDFIKINKIRERFAGNIEDEVINSLFMNGDFDNNFVDLLRDYLQFHTEPLAIRSSSLLEDSIYQPFAGIYKTYMIPNSSIDAEKRLNRVIEAIKLVYASIYHQQTLSYMKATGNRIEDEKMAVIIQDIVGDRQGDHFYPTFAGNLQTYNFYPFHNENREDGVANIALGLGRTVINGEKSLRFAPENPTQQETYIDEDSLRRNTQSHFYAVKLNGKDFKLTGEEGDNLEHLSIETAETHGTLKSVASVYSSKNEEFHESFDEEGLRVVNFNSILKKESFPLSTILKDLKRFGRQGMGCEVDAEFAVNIPQDPDKNPTFSILQVRPLVTKYDVPLKSKIEVEDGDLICQSEVCLGNGLHCENKDIVFVKTENFNPAKTKKIAKEISEINKEFDEEHPYILMGPGRWGSADKSVGIPIIWGDICNVAAIVEVGLPNFYIKPSFGGHFFQNLTSLGIFYLVTSPENYLKNIDFDWLNILKPVKETEFIKHVRFEEACAIQIDGKIGHGLILKPGMADKCISF